MIRYSVDLPDELMQRMRELAARNGVSVAIEVKKAIVTWLYLDQMRRQIAPVLRAEQWEEKAGQRILPVQDVHGQPIPYSVGAALKDLPEDAQTAIGNAERDSVKYGTGVSDRHDDDRPRQSAQKDGVKNGTG